MVPIRAFVAAAIRRPLLLLLALVVTGSAAAYVWMASEPAAPTRAPVQVRWDDAETAGRPADVASVEDSDGDGLSDIAENYVWGSNPQAWSTTGSGIPDGWLARYGLNPTRPGWERASLPLPSSLPESLGDNPKTTKATIGELYRLGRPSDWSESRDGPWNNGLDPRAAATQDGIAIGWLIRQGLDPRDPNVGDKRLADDDQSVRENYAQGTDPTRRDTDGDGLNDLEEVQIYKTDPVKESTTGSGIPDGWLVRWGLDPTDPKLPHSSFAGKGMSVREVYLYNEFRFGRISALAGAGLDPRVRSHVGGTIPDGWAVGNGLDPLDPDPGSKVLRRASQFPAVRDLAEAGGLSAIPDLALTVSQAYAHNRPTTWDEARDGPWQGGLKPRDADSDADGLPDVVELRGWYIKRTVGFGSTRLTVAVKVHADPLRADSDADGLSDGEEYQGWVRLNGVERRFHPSDPKNPDTAYSGLTDGEKVLGVTRGARTFSFAIKSPSGNEEVQLQPNTTDSDADGLRDGEELAYWIGASQSDASAYRARFPYSGLSSVFEWMQRLGPVKARGIVLDTASAARALAPDGDADFDGLQNILDPDADGDGLLDGWEVDPTLLAFSEFASPFARGALDPANPDTDGDQLPDAWELRYGSYRPEENRWDLDASRFRSDGTNPDGEANLDGDAIDWYAFELLGGTTMGHRQEFEFTNILEFQAGTDPRKADQNRDGVPEAWAFFWGTFYPILLQSGDGSAGRDPGDLRPDLGTVSALASRFSVSDPQLGKATKNPTGAKYWRFEQGASPPLDAERRERVLRTDAVTEPGTGRQIQISTIEGVYVLRFVEEYRLGTNPYLGDTDGDNLPDDWEALTGQCFLGANARSPSPIVADATADPDLDGRTNLEEFETLRHADAFGTDPCRGDTDRGGLDDGQEAFLHRNPLRPTDDSVSSGPGGGDSDLDGINDADEVLGGTDPQSVDTDRDGLIDGQDLAFAYSPGGAPPPQAQNLLARGIVWVESTSPDATVLTFRGEKPLGTSASDPDTANDGIPDGWKVAWGLPASQSFPQHRVRYEAGKPGWWDEEKYGVWWWGIPPNANPSSFATDLDLDGLDDTNGEDPVPAARHACCLTNVHPLQATGSDEAWLAAQAYGEHAGNPAFARAAWAAGDYDGDGVLDARDRAPTQTVITSVEQPPGTAIPAGARLLKGDQRPFVIRGRVAIDCVAFGCQGQPPAPANRVVAAYLDAPFDAEPLGAAVTAPDGSFAITACICGPHSISLPHAGIVFKNKDSGTVAWTFPAAQIPVGEASMRVRTLATTSTFWNNPNVDQDHPQRLTIVGEPATGPAVVQGTAGSVSSSRSHNVGSETRVRLSAPDAVKWAPSPRIVQVPVTLSDVTARPIEGHTVSLSWLGQTKNAGPTDGNGRATTEFTIPSALSAQVPVRASFAGEGASLLPSQDESPPIPVQGPSHLELEPLPERVVVGESLEVRGHLLSGSEGVTNVPVILSFEHANGIVPTLSAFLTGARGKFGGQVEVPASSSGPLLVRAHFEGTPLYAASSDEQPLAVLSGVLLRLLDPPTHLFAKELSVVRGEALSPEGASLDGHKVILRIGSHEQESMVRQGLFWFEIRLLPTFQPGAYRLEVSHPEQFDTIAATIRSDVLVSGSSLLQMGGGRATRGGTALATGRLATPAEDGIGGQVITVSWGGRKVGEGVTGPAGQVSARWTVPANASLGPGLLVSRFAGSQDGRFGATASTATWTIVDAVRLLIEGESGPQDRELVILHGRVLAASGAPAAGLKIRALLGETELAQAQSGDAGDWRLHFPLPSQLRAGPLPVTVATEGNETLGSGNETVLVVGVANSELRMAPPSVLGIGAEARIPIELFELGGPAIMASEVEWELGTARGTVRLLGEPAEIVFPVPSDLAPGTYRLSLTYHGDEHRSAARAQTDVVLRMAARLEIEDAPNRLEPGGRFALRIRLLDDAGRPVGGEPVAMSAGDARVPLLAITDADGYASFAVVSEGEGILAYAVRYAGSDVLAPAALEEEVEVAAMTINRAESLALIVVSLAAAALLIIGGFLWLRLRPLARVRKALLAAARGLVAADDNAASILLAYEKLSKAFQRYGYWESGSETAREFLAGLARFFPTSPEYLNSLADLFERARYDRMPLGSGDRERALELLRHLLGDLDRYVIRLRLGHPVPEVNA